MSTLITILSHGFALAIGASIVAVIASKKIHNINKTPTYVEPRDAIHTNL